MGTLLCDSDVFKVSAKVKLNTGNSGVVFTQPLSLSFGDFAQFIREQSVTDLQSGLLDYVRLVVSRKHPNRDVESFSLVDIKFEDLESSLKGLSADVADAVDAVDVAVTSEGVDISEVAGDADVSDVAEDVSVAGDVDVRSSDDLRVQHGISSREQFLAILDELNDKVKAECDKVIGYTWCVKNARRLNCAIELYRNYSIMNHLRDCLMEMPFEEYRYLADIKPKYFKRVKRSKKD